MRRAATDKLLISLGVLWCILGAPPSFATSPGEKDSEASKFLRLSRTDRGDLTGLQTSVVTYGGMHEGEEVRVDLVGAVHVGERAYYEELNRRFTEYDAVLYELVALHDATPRPGRAGGSPVSFLQMTMKDVLGLEFQLEVVNYDAANFVHADMTPAEFAASMKQRGESFTQLFFRMVGQSIATQSKDPTRSSDARLMAALLSPAEQRQSKLKAVLAEQFEDIDAATAALAGPEGSTLLTERNKAALAVLRRELGAGKRRVAVFYGAAHHPDLARRMREQFGLREMGIQWLTAWDLSDASGD